MGKLQKTLSLRLHELLKSSFENSSENLARFARRRDYMKNHNRILKSGDGKLYIGINDDGWLTGSELNRVVCGDFKTWAFANVEVRNCEDVTEWFIEEYKQKGMCAYTDMRHEWLEDYNESSPDGTIRTCVHCGKVETLKSKMVRKIWWE